jgi:formylglycine-generating enzyme required for sulfatase activity
VAGVYLGDDIFAETSNGELTEAIKIDTTPTRIGKVNCSPELDPHADEFIAAYREHEAEMYRRGAPGFETMLISGEVLQENHSIGCTLVMGSVLHCEMREDALLLARSPQLMECRPYVVTDDLVKRMVELKREGRSSEEPIVFTLAWEAGVDPLYIRVQGKHVSRLDAICRYLAEVGVVLALATPEEHADAEKRLKGSRLWLDPASQAPLSESLHERLSEASRREIELAAGREEYQEYDFVYESDPHDPSRRRPGTLTLDLGGGVTMALLPIPAGQFMMGSPKAESGRQPNDEPLHRAKIAEPFHIGAYEVTQAQYEQIMGENPSHFRNGDNPVEMVSWNEAVEFCRRLSKRSGRRVRLPTETEWEYAARAGSGARFCFGDDAKRLAGYTCYTSLWCRKPHPVGRWRPNAWGLHDTHGNVKEWCAGWYRQDTSGKGCDRVLRGGEWGDPDYLRRSANRAWGGSGKGRNEYGFRVVAEAADR